MKVKQILGNNFIGLEELIKVQDKLNIPDPESFGKIPEIPFNLDLLRKYQDRVILVLGIPKDREGNPLTLNCMRNLFGVDPNVSEPCFYNQDWYIKEDFAQKTTLEFKWYLISKTVYNKTRSKRPDEIENMLAGNEHFPSAILTAFTFFSYFFLNNDQLWKNDFTWCSDRDHNEDIIYTGRYIDTTGVNKNGFNVHRHLSIRPVYGLAPQII